MEECPTRMAYLGGALVTGICAGLAMPGCAACGIVTESNYSCACYLYMVIDVMIFPADWLGRVLVG